jgi:hypothetical protein
MNWDWGMIGAQAKALFAKAAQLFVFQMACLYLLGCTVALRPLGPKGFVEFVHHTFQWPVSKGATKPARKAQPPETATQ